MVECEKKRGEEEGITEGKISKQGKRKRE